MTKKITPTRKPTSVQLEVRWLPPRFPAKWVFPPEDESLPQYALINAVERLNDYPRLERDETYPGDWTDIPVWLKSPEVEARITKWLARGPIYRDVLKLLKVVFIDDEVFMAETLKVVNKHAPLNLEGDDTLQEWERFIIDVNFLYRLNVKLKEILLEGGLNTQVDIKDLGINVAKKMLLSVNVWPKRAHYSSRYNWYSYSKAQVDVEALAIYRAFEMRLDFYIDQPSVYHYMNTIADLLRGRLIGQIVATPNGVWLKCGALSWAMLELSELFSSAGLRFCIARKGDGECGNELTGKPGRKLREDAKTCCEACEATLRRDSKKQLALDGISGSSRQIEQLAF